MFSQKAKIQNQSSQTILENPPLFKDKIYQPCYLRVAERRKTAEEVKLIALQPKKPAKRKIELLEKIFEINRN